MAHPKGARSALPLATNGTQESFVSHTKTPESRGLCDLLVKSLPTIGEDLGVVRGPFLGQEGGGVDVTMQGVPCFLERTLLWFFFEKNRNPCYKGSNPLLMKKDFA